MCNATHGMLVGRAGRGPLENSSIHQNEYVSLVATEEQKKNLLRDHKNLDGIMPVN